MEVVKMGTKELIQNYCNFPEINKEIRTVISDNMAGYYLADSGEIFGVYFDDGKFSVSIGQSVGSEIAPEERPIAGVKCLGIGDLDSSFFTDGWTTENEDGTYTSTETGNILSLEDCIRECCDSGDVCDDIESLLDELMHDLTESINS